MTLQEAAKGCRLRGPWEMRKGSPSGGNKAISPGGKKRFAKELEPLKRGEMRETEVGRSKRRRAVSGALCYHRERSQRGTECLFVQSFRERESSLKSGFLEHTILGSRTTLEGNHIVGERGGPRHNGKKENWRTAPLRAKFPGARKRKGGVKMGESIASGPFPKLRKKKIISGGGGPLGRISLL